MNAETFQTDLNGNSVRQTQSGEPGAADVNVVGGSVGLDQSVPGQTNAVAIAPAIYGGSLNAFTATAANSLIIKAGPGKLFGLSGYNAKGSAQFILLFDSATVPVEGVIPRYFLTAATVANFNADFGVYGKSFANGIVVCNSSTVATKTIGSADCSFEARYV